MLVNVLTGYIPQPEYLVELTCVSNTLGGLLLLTDGIWNITKRKSIPSSFYLNVAVSILMVFLVCMGSFTGAYQFNFKGAFFFMHVINPIAFVICYMFFVDERGRKRKAVLMAPLLSMLYFSFDYIRSRLVGKFVYGFVEPGELTFFDAILVGMLMYLLIYLLGLGLFAFNRYVHGKSNG